ncbi:hypothetical protein BGZ61DRAFT_451010 [Ilyonectria robusta]|uniref:uncharacterized protein n=1 Tax=Ilyonectria robusta TaxID=1079257 RepID=UPI001E8CD25F|nr:uncharacterized protein BGZ61DRAFT_451010 [Ilyonectria robusta]KAH8699617.1 hypothetical protein BGZ61DRAFT_451010 [Ilyonectria robusta]
MTHLVALAAFDILRVRWFLAFGNLVTRFPAVLARKLVNTRFRAVSDAVTVAATVVARNLGGVGSLNLFLLTVLGTVTEFLAVEAQWNPFVNNLSGIIQTRENLGAILWPTLNFARTIGFLREPIGDGVLFPHVSLEIHVGKNADQRPLSCNQPKTDILFDKSLLELSISDIALKSFDVLLYGFLGIVNFALRDCLLELLPGFIGIDGGNMIAVDLASVLAILSHMTFLSAVLAQHRRLIRAVSDHMSGLLAVAAGHVLTRLLSVGTLSSAMASFTATEALVIAVAISISMAEAGVSLSILVKAIGSCICSIGTIGSAVASIIVEG